MNCIANHIENVTAASAGGARGAGLMPLAAGTELGSLAVKPVH